MRNLELRLDFILEVYACYTRRPCSRNFYLKCLWLGYYRGHYIQTRKRDLFDSPMTLISNFCKYESFMFRTVSLCVLDLHPWIMILVAFFGLYRLLNSSKDASLFFLNCITFGVRDCLHKYKMKLVYDVTQSIILRIGQSQSPVRSETGCKF